MEHVFNRITQSGILALVLGILSIVFGVTVGVLTIISGSLLLRDRKDITF